MDKPGADLAVSIENEGQWTRSMDIFSVPYPSSPLVVRSMDNPLFNGGREGG